MEAYHSRSRTGAALDIGLNWSVAVGQLTISQGWFPGSYHLQTSTPYHPIRR